MLLCASVSLCEQSGGERAGIGAAGRWSLFAWRLYGYMLRYALSRRAVEGF